VPVQVGEEFEELIRLQSKLLFGGNTIFVSTKRKLAGLTLGATIPDGFLFDMSDVENPDFYLVEVELQKHDFHRHIFPQITKFFAFSECRQSGRSGRKTVCNNQHRRCPEISVQKILRAS
jgi:hypothetical protein